MKYIFTHDINNDDDHKYEVEFNNDYCNNFNFVDVYITKLPNKYDKNQKQKVIASYDFPVEELWRIASALRKQQIEYKREILE